MSRFRTLGEADKTCCKYVRQTITRAISQLRIPHSPVYSEDNGAGRAKTEFINKAHATATQVCCLDRYMALHYMSLKPLT